MSTTPRLVAVSIALYRLLVAAYPAAFRAEYGEAMIQLFRDTALDGYRRRRELGLLLVWLRTLGDFSVSVVRQHREKTTEAPSETVLLRDLARQWGQLGSSTISVTTSSMGYVLHLAQRFFGRPVLAWGTFTLLAFAIWLGSFFEPFTLSHAAPRISIGRGIVWIRALSEVGEPISDEQFQTDCLRWRENNQPRIDELQAEPRPWQFSFVSEIPGATIVQYSADRQPRIVKPFKYWELRLPSLLVPTLLLWGTIRAWRRRKPVGGPAMQVA